MFLRIKLPISVLLLFCGAALCAQGRTALLEQFELCGQTFSLNAVFFQEQADLHLQGMDMKNLSAGMEGENILLGTRIGNDNFYVFWLNHRQKAIRLAYYDHRRDRSRILALTGFSFIALPEIIEADDDLQGLVFLGNRSNNDDIFYYEPEQDLLTPLTETPFSEKGFQLLETDGQLEIETRSLRAKFRYHFDPVLRKSSLMEENPFSARRKKSTAAITDAEYYNTYIGFGDSITWGEIEGDQHAELCYLAQMQDLLADPSYANYYGSSSSVNLGVPGDDTADGAERIDQDLDDHSGLYLLLMLGVNDVININMSIDSSLESLGYIIDAAKARGMRVIVSTPTPSKSFFSSYSFYWRNLQGLSVGILALALDKNVASIDSLAAFMNTDPPDGWKKLLETIIPNVSSGNHPNAAGHRLIASLFAAALVGFPPLSPQDIVIIDPKDPLRRTVFWSPCFESDFSHFHVAFGFQPGALKYFLDTAASYCTFQLFPFLPQLYFHIQVVDRGGRQSEFVTQDAAVSASGLRTKKTK
ncbi:MAG: SGNH/GDSL hydrolase family protein [Acidobacteriota bacterium]|nr:SGNH/GDSL hydrolase family protein [Acidobacteriota bacterium]